MKAIVVCDKNWGIGKDNNLLCHLPGDLKYFKEKTMGKVLIMGRKTLESLPGGKPLPGRTTIVMTRNENYGEGIENLVVVNNFDELMQEVLKMEAFDGIDIDNDVFVAGGESIYNDLCPYCDTFLVTKIDKAFEADKHFLDMDKMVEAGMMKISWESEPMEEKGIKYCFRVYERA